MVIVCIELSFQVASPFTSLIQCIIPYMVLNSLDKPISSHRLVNPYPPTSSLSFGFYPHLRIGSNPIALPSNQQKSPPTPRCPSIVKCLFRSLSFQPNFESIVYHLISRRLCNFSPSIKSRAQVEQIFEIKQKNPLKLKTLSKFLQSNLEEKFHLIIPNMSVLRTQNHNRRCLITSKSGFNNILLNISQIKKPYNQQIKKRSFTPNHHQKTSNRNQAPIIKENCAPLVVKGQKQLSLPQSNTYFGIECLEKYILSPAGKDQRKRFVYNIYRGVIYSLLKLKPPSQDIVKQRQVYLSEPTISHKKFLLLDLDETLICAERTGDSEGKASYRFIYRPHLFSFLERMNELFEVYAFTAAQKGYAEAVVKKLNRGKVLIKDVLHRQHCLETRKGKFLKDLRIIKNRQLQDIVIIDNLVESFGLQINNGVPILEFKGSSHDVELLKIIPLMQKLSEAEDVRNVLREVFRLEEVGNLDKKDVEAYFSRNQ